MLSVPKALRQGSISTVHAIADVCLRCYFLKKQPPWPTTVGHMQPPWRTAVARWLPAAVGFLQPPWATTFAKPPWATAAAVGHGDWLSKLKNFETVV
jgi:hypothetical protein